MDIRQLKTFQVVSNLMSFSRAAQRLHYAQSSISAQIRALEDDLGVRLFDRLGKRIILTEAGERLLLYANKIIDLAEESRAQVIGGTDLKGSLTIRLPESFGGQYLPPVIRSFRTRHQRVSLSFTTCSHDGLAEDLRRGVTDLAFLLTDSIHAPDLEKEVLGYDQIKMVSGPQHPWLTKETVLTRDLKSETILLSNVDCSYRKLFQAILEEQHTQPDAILEFSSINMIKRCVSAGVGITVLPQSAIYEDIENQRLAVLPWEEKGVEIAQLMLWYKDRWLSPTLKTFMEEVRNAFAK